MVYIVLLAHYVLHYFFMNQKLKKDLAKVKSAEQQKKIIKAIKILKQRRATEKDIDVKRRVKLSLRKEQVENLKAGKRVSFLTRRKLIYHYSISINLFSN